MNFQQQPHTLLMVRPKHFGFNIQTATSNAFQKEGGADENSALNEFDKMVDLLRANEIDVQVVDDTPDPAKPDAIFPNNWLSTHETGRVILYPMMAENRRKERRLDIVETLKEKFVVTQVYDLSSSERKSKFLEGTGSIVFDHVNSLAYACRSPRTDADVLRNLCSSLDYKPVIFDASDESGKAIYHTNVLMSIGEHFAVVCLNAIRNDNDQELILGSLSDTAHKVISLSFAQMQAFAGNIIEVKNTSGENIVLMSTTAFNSLLPGQLNAITEFAEVLPIPVPTIEKIGGGGVRCMVAGIHLPIRKA